MRRVLVALGAAVAGCLAPLGVVAIEGPSPSRGPAFPDVDATIARLAASEARGWALVEEARMAVAGQFVEYSALTPWLSAREAFRRRRGYSPQYNGALTEVLHGLGIEAERVFAARVATEGERPWWRSAHVWVRVRVDGRVRDVCAGLGDAVGENRFTPLTDVQPFGDKTRVNTTIVLALAAAAQLWRARLTGRPLPRWMRRPFHEPA